ncbi:hypothetical protein OAA30_00485, partial [bacterium]|nr:hypothetical protein [bacterium]
EDPDASKVSDTLDNRVSSVSSVNNIKGGLNLEENKDSEEEMNYLDNIEDSIESIRGEPTEKEYTTNMIIELK